MKKCDEPWAHCDRMEEQPHVGLNAELCTGIVSGPRYSEQMQIRKDPDMNFRLLSADPPSNSFP